MKNIFSYILIALLLVSLAGVGYFATTTINLGKQLTASQDRIKATEASSVFQLPPNLVKISECVPTEGEHWMNPKNLPHGPLYGVYKGKVISIEYMFLPSDIGGAAVSKLNFPDTLKFMQQNNLTLDDYVHLLGSGFDLFGFKYTYFTIHWIVAHAGLTVPHYDFHFYLVSKEEANQVCPDAKLEDVYSPDVMNQIHQNNIPFPGENPPEPTPSTPAGIIQHK